MDNVVWMIGEKNSRRFFDAKRARFDERVTFGMFYPDKTDCDHVLRSIVSSSNRYRYTVVEAEVLRFDGTEIIVAYDDSFRDESLTNFSLY
jgi:hypothetical protein